MIKGLKLKLTAAVLAFAIMFSVITPTFALASKPEESTTVIMIK